MLIGELVKKSKVSKDTIRYYEKRGLLFPNQNKLNKYKDYGPESVQILGFITKAQALGFSLKEIKSILDLISKDNYECSVIETMLDEKIEIIDDKIQNLKLMRSNLNKIKEMILNEEIEDELSVLESLKF